MRAEESKATTENLLTGSGELGALLRACAACAEGNADWSQTSLGAVETWSEDLKTAVQILLTELDRAKPIEKTSLDSDLSENGAAKAALPQSDQLNAFQHDTFRHLVENSPFGVYIVDADFRIAQVSAGAQKAFENVRPRIGRDFAEALRVIWSEPFASEAITHFRHTLETGEPYHAPNTIERRHDVGGVEFYDWKIERITLTDGRFGVVCHFYDLSERQRYETALQGEDQFRNMANSSPVLIWQTDETGVTFVNRHYLEFFAQTLDAVKGMGWANFLHPNDAAAYIGAYQTAFARQEQYEFQCRFLRHDGEYRWLQNVGKPHYGLDGTFLGFVGCSIDVTDIKAAAEISQRTANLDAFRVSLTDALRSLADPVEVQAAASRALGECLGANRVAYFEVRGTDYVVEQDYVNGAEPIAGRYPIDSFDPRQLAAFRQGRTATSSDVPADPHLSPEQRSSFAAIGIGAYIGVPLIKQGEFVAGLAVHTIEPRVWTPDEVALAEEVAERTWAAVERASAEEALRQSEARFRRIFECNMVPIAVWTTTGGITQANDALLDMIGYTRSELETEQINWQALTPPEYRSLDEIALNEIATKGVSVPYEKVYVCKDGRRIPILIGAASFLDDANSGIFFAIDLTDRKQAKAALRESEERYRTLFESIDQGFCLLEVLFDANDKAYDYRFVEINEAFEQQSGLTDAVGKTILELVPNLEPQWIERYEQVVKLREAVRFEADVPSMNRVFDIYAVPSGAPGQNPVSVLFTDITERKRREANLAFLAEVQDDCARFTTAEDIMQTVGAKIGAYLNLAICAFVDVDEAQDQAIVPYCWHRADVPNLVGTYRISNFVSEEFYIAARAGVVVIVNDTNTDARTDAASCAAIGVQSFIHVPLLRDGQWKFLFNVYDARPRNWREDEIELFSELANRIFQSLERARAEAALRNSEERFRLMANVVPPIVWISDAEGRIEFFNQQWSDYTGVPYEPTTAAEVAARFVHPEDGDRTMVAFNEARRSGSIFSVEHRIRSAAGTYRWFIVRAEPYRDPQTREIVRWFGASMDIHDRKIAEQEREQLLAREQAARETAENANRIKDEFLAVLSHELRSPLNPILGWAKLLQSGNLDAARTKAALATIDRNAQLQAQLIDDLLDISRILRGKLSLDAAPVDLKIVIAAALETVRLAAEAKSLPIQTTISPDVGVVMGDAGRLQQVVWNLLSNAVKFTPPGGQIFVTLTQTETHAQIQARDTGKGIKPEFLPYVFEHFRQEDGATTRKFGGLGLGLAIARQIVELHGGQISVDSPGEGQGATFTVQLPPASRSSQLSAAVSPSISTDSDLQGIHILVVDDELDSREFVAFVLEQAGAIVTSVASGIEALQTIEQAVPNLVVSDIGMPEMDGYMLMQQIRASGQGQHIPAIALTAYAGEFDRQQALKAGFQQHVPKPVDPTEIISMVACLCRNKEGNRE